MDRRDWLEVGIRGYGAYLVLGAALTIVEAAIEFVFGDLGFGATFRAVLRSGAAALLGMLAMTRVEDAFRFMRMPARDGATAAPSTGPAP